MRSISLKELFRQMRLNEAARSPEERKKEYEVAYLQMQMRPHFLD